MDSPNKLARADMVPRVPATLTDLREVEARLRQLIADADARLARVELLASALHLGSTSHPEWLSPGAGPAAKARRAAIAEAVLSLAGPDGMTLRELAAYLHVPPDGHDTLRGDIAYLSDADRVTRNTSQRYRTKA